MRRGSLAVGTLFALAVSSQASAAPGSSGRQFDVSVQGGVEYDSNLPRTSEAIALTRHQVPEDVTYTPRITVTGAVPIGRSSFFVDGFAGYSYHQNNSNLDSESLSLNAGLDSRISICQTRVSGGYSRHLSDFEDITAATTITNILETATVGLNASCGRRTGIGTNFSVAHTESTNDTSLLRPQDNSSDFYSAGLSYSRPTLGSVSVFGSYSRTEFPHRGGLLFTSRGYEVKAFGLTYDRHLGARIEGQLSLSYSDQKQIGSSVLFPARNFAGLTYSADLKYRVTSRLDTSISASRALAPSNRIGNNYDLNTNYGVTANYRLGQRIHLHAAAQRRERHSSGDGPVLVTSLTNSDDNVFSAGARYELNRRISLSLDASQEQRKTNSPLFDSRNNQVAATVVVRY
jgi:hypothetical protein